VDQLYWLLGLGLLLVGVVVFTLFAIVQRLDAVLRQLLLLQRKADQVLTHLGIQPPPEHFPLSERVKELATDPARKIQAIKVYREETGAGLMEAKDAVEEWIRESAREKARSAQPPLSPGPRSDTR
jgi:ribosomal protein L7/L12